MDDDDEPQAGPSNLGLPPPEQEAEALQLALSQVPFFSVEYPGYVAKDSIPEAIRRLGGEPALNAAFRRSNAAKKEALLELNLRPDNPFSHPIPGDIIGTSSILLRVRKKKYKHPREDAQGNPVLGEYVVDVPGLVQKTARFRSMADYQFQPNPEDPLVKLRHALENMDVEALRDYRIPPENEDYYISDGESQRSNVRVFPPPLFGRQHTSQNYNYKPNPTSIETTVVDPTTGEERTRLVNKQRWKGWAPIAVQITDSIPTEGPANARAELANTDPGLLEKIKQVLATRPIWSRIALFSQFEANEIREIANGKWIMPTFCYIFNDGPWRDSFIRLGYDPRTDKGSRIYQRIVFRNTNAYERASLIKKRQDTRFDEEGANDLEEAPRRSHIFDGQTLTTDFPHFQLCDISDPMLREMITDESAVRETFHEKDGWYTSESLEAIRTVLRHKYFSLVQGVVVTNEECRALLAEGGGVIPVKASTAPRAGKHNMAKGQLPPEEITAARLRTAIGSKSKE